MKGLKGFGVLLVAAAFWALPAKAMAIPVCGGGVDVTTYTEGCTVDGLLFTDFAVLQAGGAQELEVDAVFATLVDGTIYFNFNPNLDGDGNEDIHFYFKVATLDGSASIVGVDLSNNGFGPTSIQESLCTVSWLPAGGCVLSGGSLIGTGLHADSGEVDVDFFAPVAYAYVFKDISKDDGGHLTSFTQSFHVPDGGSTMALLGLGLLGLRAARRRFARR